MPGTMPAIWPISVPIKMAAMLDDHNQRSTVGPSRQIRAKNAVPAYTQAASGPLKRIQSGIEAP